MRVIVTIDCWLRFVCREVEVCIIKFISVIIVVVCVQSVLAERVKSRFPEMSDGKRQPSPLLVLIYVCVLF